jgi:hypothetical protein
MEYLWFRKKAHPTKQGLSNICGLEKDPTGHVKKVFNYGPKRFYSICPCPPCM